MEAITFTLHDFLRDFYTPAQCLEYLRKLRWPDGIHCRKCDRVTKHHLRPEKKAYSCQYCGTLVRPTKGTIFFGSKVALPNWFWIIFQFAKTRTGITAKQIERELGITYKTALRMCNAVRSCLEEDHTLSGQCELDETYLGNSRRYFGRKRKRGRGADKRPCFGAVQRGGAVVAKVVPNTKRETLYPIIEEHVEKGSEVFTDEYKVYASLEKMDPNLSWTYRHDTVNHSQGQYVKYRRDGTEVHTNEIEGFWSYPKNAIKGVHRGVSDRHLQGYVNEYAFRQSHRKDEQPLFFTMLRHIVPVERLAA